MKTFIKYLPMTLLVCSTASGDDAATTEVERLRSSTETQVTRQTISAVVDNRSASWQASAPKSLKHSLRPHTSGDFKLSPRLDSQERGTIDRFTAATEQLPLGLSADPPRPSFPQFAAGPRSSGTALSTLEHLQLPLLSRTSDPPFLLTIDPATIAAKPFTMSIVKAIREPAAPRADVIPDPFIARDEVQLRAIPIDTDPPAVSLEMPEKPVYDVKPLKK